MLSLGISFLLNIGLMIGISALLIYVLILLISIYLIVTDKNIIIRILFSLFLLFSVLGIAFLQNTALYLGVISAIYSILISIINLTTSLQRMIPTKGKSGKWDLFKSVASLAFAIVLIVFSGFTNRYLMIIAGIYCVLVSTYSLSKGKLYNWLRFRGRPIALLYPIVFDIPLPYIWKDIYKANDNAMDLLKEEEDLAEHPEHRIVQIQVVTGSNPIDVVGHTALTYKGKTYTYGNHDLRTRSLFAMVGKGVMLESDAKDMEVFNRRLNATVFEYDVLIAEDDMQEFLEHMEGLKANTVPWSPADALHKKRYAGVVNRTTKTNFYKYENSVYENYFLLGTNCAWIENQAMEMTDLPNIELSGVPLPGTMLQNLERAYLAKNSMVIARRIHS